MMSGLCGGEGKLSFSMSGATGETKLVIALEDDRGARQEDEDAAGETLSVQGAPWGLVVIGPKGLGITTIVKQRGVKLLQDYCSRTEANLSWLADKRFTDI